MVIIRAEFRPKGLSAHYLVRQNRRVAFNKPLKSTLTDHFLPWCRSRYLFYSVKTDISPAEPPANYPANPSAGYLRPKNHDIRLLPSLR